MFIFCIFNYLSWFVQNFLNKKVSLVRITFSPDLESKLIKIATIVETVELVYSQIVQSLVHWKNKYCNGKNDRFLSTLKNNIFCK